MTAIGRSQYAWNFDGSNKGMPSITCPDTSDTSYQGLVQVVRVSGIPPKEAFLYVKEGIRVKVY